MFFWLGLLVCLSLGSLVGEVSGLWWFGGGVRGEGW